MFAAGKVLTWLASPFGFFTCGLLLALSVLARSRVRRSRVAAWALMIVAIAQVIAFSTYLVADAITAPLEREARAMAAQAPKSGYGAILLLGGAMSTPPVGSTEIPGVHSAFARVILAARLHHDGVAPRIIATGGRFEGRDGKLRTSEAAGMRDMLVAFGVPADAVVLEERSRNTRENAIESARLLDSGARVALVTSATHMARAVGEMRLAGIDAYAFPTDFKARPEERNAWEALPNPEALNQSSYAIKEWLGRLVQSARAGYF